MDPSNLTFVDTSPSLNPGTRFAMSCLLAGFGLFSLLISWKSGRVPIKGLMAIGLLVYLNSNRGSNLSFLSSPRYESLTQKLKGSEGGGAVIEALGESGNQRALNDFAKRERQRVSLPVTQPVTQREDFPESEQSYAILTEELGLGQQAAKILRTMLPSEIAELSRILKGLNAEEKEIFTQFVRRGINVPEAIASIPLTTPGLTVPIV
jgi:hypothetical protein